MCRSGEDDPRLRAELDALPDFVVHAAEQLVEVALRCDERLIDGRALEPAERRLVRLLRFLRRLLSAAQRARDLGLQLRQPVERLNGLAVAVQVLTRTAERLVLVRLADHATEVARLFHHGFVHQRLPLSDDGRRDVRGTGRVTTYDFSRRPPPGAPHSRCAAGPPGPARCAQTRMPGSRRAAPPPLRPGRARPRSP